MEIKVPFLQNTNFMSAEIIKQAEKAKERAMVINRIAIEKNIKNISQNFAEISGIKRGDTHFKRQAGMTDDAKDRNNFFGRFLDHWLSISFAGERRGNLYVQEINSIHAWRKSLDFRRIRRDFWTIEEESVHLQIELRKAFIGGDILPAQRALLQIKLNADEMLDVLADQEFIKNEYFPVL